MIQYWFSKSIMQIQIVSLLDFFFNDNEINKRGDV